MLRRRLVPIIGEPGAEFHEENDFDSDSDSSDDDEQGAEEVQKGKPLDEKPVSYRRCMWISNIAFLKAQRKHAEERRVEEERLEAKRVERAAKKAEREAAKLAKALLDDPTVHQLLSDI